MTTEDSLEAGDFCSGETRPWGDRRDSPLAGAARSCWMPRFRPASVMLLLGLDRGVGGCGGCWEFSDAEPWLRLAGTLMVVFDLFRGTTGLI